MTERQLKQEQAAFKAWYVARLCKSGTYRILASEISTGLRFAVERNGQLMELWRKEGSKYVRIL